MKILYLITGLRLGGAEKQLLLLCGNMQVAGFQILVVAMEPDGALVNEFKNAGIEVVDLGITGLGSLFAGYWKLKRLVSQFCPTVIHSHMIHANFLASIFKLFNNRCKLVVTAHNIKEGNNWLMKGYRLLNFIPNWSTNVSEEAYRYFVSSKYFNPDKSSCIPNAIDTIRFDPAKFIDMEKSAELNIRPGEIVFLTVGRLHQQKNHKMLLNAFKEAKKEVCNALLLIAGDGPLMESLTKLSIELGISEDVYFLGERDDVAALMNLCSCFVLSSNFEGFGMVVGEAMAMQKPVIATDCGGVAEVMGNLGKLVQVNNTFAMADAMIEHSNHHSPMNENIALRKHIENRYATNKIHEKWVALYRCL